MLNKNSYLLMLQLHIHHLWLHLGFQSHSAKSLCFLYFAVSFSIFQLSLLTALLRYPAPTLLCWWDHWPALESEGYPVHMIIQEPLLHCGPSVGVLACVCVCVCAQSLSRVQLVVTLWTAACQDPLSMQSSRQEYWNGCHALLQHGPNP